MSRCTLWSHFGTGILHGTVPLILGLVFAASGCLGGGQTVSRSLDESTGKASYYGEEFAGKQTANGETFDPSALTAAHPSLPFGTKVRVTRTDGSGRSVVVRVNDRGPFADNRIIDLSKAAAREIGMLQEGVVEVRLKVIDLPKTESSKRKEATAKGW